MKLYTSIVDLPLYLFMDAICDEKLHSIVISGYPTPDELERAWEELLHQHNEKMGDAESRLMFSLFKQILQRDCELKMIDIALAILVDSYVPRLVEELNGIFHVSFSLDFSNRQDYDQKLQVFRNLKGSVKMTRDLKQLQYDSIKKKKESSNKKPDREYFQTMLLNISDFAKYEVNDHVSVFTYCERINRLTKFLESLDKK